MTLDRQLATASIGADVAPVESVELILDRTWSPFGQGSVTVGGLFPELDPDTLPEPRFRLRISQRFSYGLTGSEIAALLAGLSGSEITAPPSYSAWVEQRRNLCGNPVPATVTGWAGPSNAAVDADGYTQALSSVTTPYIFSAGSTVGAVAGRVYAFRAKIKGVRGAGSVFTTLQVRPHRRTGNTYYNVPGGNPILAADGVTREVAFYFTAPATFPAGENFDLSIVGNGTGAAGTKISMKEVLIEDVGTVVPSVPPLAYFSGASASSDLLRHRYLTALPSASVEETRTLTPAGPWDGLTGSQIAALYQADLNPERIAPRSLYADLTIREVELDLEAGTTTFAVATDDARLWDAARVATSPEAFASTSIRAIVETIVARVGGSLEEGTANGTLEFAPVLTPGTSYRDFLTPLLQAGGLRLYATERRVWRLESVDAVLSDTVSLSTARDVAGARPKIDRERGGFDSVVIEYKWTTVDGFSLVRYDVAGPPSPRKTQRITYEDTPYPGPGAAAKVLDRVRRRRREIPVDAAANYDARPGMAAIFTSAALAQQSGRLARVVFTYPARIMRADMYDLEEINPRSVRAIPVGIKTNQLPGKTNTLNPGEL